mgnify:CR=1 FL=1
MRTAIVTDSNSGITQAEAQKMNVFVLPMPVIIEGQAYYEGIDLLPDQFFRALTERQAVSTSQPSPGDVTALWDKVLAEYEELVYIPMSSGLSASCATAQMLAEDYEGRVFVVDNHRISISQKSSAWDAVALREAGCAIAADEDGLTAVCRQRLRAGRPGRTAPYPGFPTDLQAIFMALAAAAEGYTAFTETVFPRRWAHVEELRRLGADITVVGSHAVIRGAPLIGSALTCTDLRAGAAVVLAALAAKGESSVTAISHIERGYADFVPTLRHLGADIYLTEV